MRPSDAEGVPELHEVDIPDELREQIETSMSRYPQLRSASIPALWAVQRYYGWCSPEGIRQAAAVMGVTPAYLQSVASFYDLFATAPVGRHRVLVCHNISCWMNGADGLLEAFCEATGADHHDADHAARPRPTASSSSRASSASAPATSRRWSRSTSATTARSTTRTRLPRSRRSARATSRFRTRRSPSARPRRRPRAARSLTADAKRRRRDVG